MPPRPSSRSGDPNALQPAKTVSSQDASAPAAGRERFPLAGVQSAQLFRRYEASHLRQEAEPPAAKPLRRTGMKAQTSTCCGVTMTRIFRGGVLASLGLTAVWAAMMAAPGGDRSPGAPNATEVAAKPVSAMPDGKELFAREWISHDPRSPRGDGVGPVV